MTELRAAVVVHMQQDYAEGQCMGVHGAGAAVRTANTMLMLDRYELVIYVNEWHPPDHKSFASQWGLSPFAPHPTMPDTILWPDHCVVGTPGVQPIDDLITNPPGAGAIIIKTGQDPGVESHSAFADNGRNLHTGLAQWLRMMKITDIDVFGFYTERAVYYTVLDAIRMGYRVKVIEAACCGRIGHSEAILQMKNAGADII